MEQQQQQLAQGADLLESGLSVLEMIYQEHEVLVANAEQLPHAVYEKAMRQLRTADDLLQQHLQPLQQLLQGEGQNREQLERAIHQLQRALEEAEQLMRCSVKGLPFCLRQLLELEWGE